MIRASISEYQVTGETQGNRDEVRSIVGVIEELGIDVYCVVEHAERWGEVVLEPKDLLRPRSKKSTNPTYSSRTWQIGQLVLG